MNNSNPKRLSIEERMEMIRNSKASSPEAAAAKLRTIGAYPPANLIKDTRDLTLLFDDCGLGRFDGLPGLDINHFSEFAPFFRYSLYEARGKNKVGFTETENGVQFINSMVLLASMVLDKIKEKGKDLHLFNALNMSLGDLWDAAVGTCVNKDGVIDEDRKEKLIRAREVYMMNRNPEVSLKVELASILDLYQDGWYSYGKIHHILSCDEELMDYMIRQEEAERMFEEEYDPDDYDYEDYDYDFSYETNEDICGNGTDEVEPVEMCESKVNEDLEQYYEDTNADVDTHNLFMDPTGYYLNKADDFTKPVDNFYDDKVKHIRSEILLPGEAYSKKDLENLRRSINHSRFLKKFDEIVNNPDFDKSKLMCESSAMLIYHLLVFPFLEMDNYHFETWAMES